MRLRFLTLALLLGLWVSPGYGQSCAMCYASAKGANQKGQKALSRAVTVLLLPPVGLMTLVIGFAFHYGRKRDKEENDNPL